MTSIRLSQLAGIIQATLQQRFASQLFWVLTDVSDHKYYPDRDTHYFELVEKDPTSGRLLAKLSAVAWSDGAKNIQAFEKSTSQRFRSGIHILCCVKIDFHVAYGLKLHLVDIDISFTLGELERQKRETIERLLRECPDFIQKQGDVLITRNKGLSLNLILKRIAVIGSKQSAGYDDFIHTLTNNLFGYTFNVDLYHTQVQGENNAAAVVDQMIRIHQSGVRYDVLVIIRGGGAETDFLIFNDFYICRAVAKFPVPIISGIGHLKDQTITDLLVHTETNAPTKAAEFIVAHNRKFEEALLSIQQTVVIRSQQQLANAQRKANALQTTIVNRSRDLLIRQHDQLNSSRQVIMQNSKDLLKTQQHELSKTAHHLLSAPRIMVAQQKQLLHSLAANVASFQKQFFKNQTGLLKHYSSLVNMASPEKILNRGFAIIRKGDQIITSPEDLLPGEDITIQLKQTILTAELKSNKDGA